MAPSAAIVVQARMGSTRFPGKSLAPFAGSTVLAHMLRRLRSVDAGPALVVATGDGVADDAVEEASRAAGVSVVRGPETDVLRRFALAVESLDPRPELIVRICADRPLICPRLVELLLDAYDAVGRPDYLSNNLPPSYPDGLDVELVRRVALLAADADAADPYEREHVTPFLYRRPERFSIVSLPCPYGNYSGARVALDTHDDHAALVRVHEALPEGYDHLDVLNLWTLRPELFP